MCGHIIIIGGHLFNENWNQQCYCSSEITYHDKWQHLSEQYRYNDVIRSTMAFQITSFTIVYSTVYSSADQRKHQSSASLAFVRGIHRWSVNSRHKGPVTREMFPFDDVIMTSSIVFISWSPYKSLPGSWYFVCHTNEWHGLVTTGLVLITKIS